MVERTPRDSTETFESLRDSINLTNKILEQVNTNLKTLSRRTIWNRIGLIALAGLIVVVSVLGFVAWRQSETADHNLRIAQMDTCEKFNELTERIVIEEHNFILTLAKFLRADDQTVGEFIKTLEGARGDTLDPINCSKDI